MGTWLFIFVKRNTEKITKCRGWLYVGGGGGQNGEDSGSKTSCVYLSI